MDLKRLAAKTNGEPAEEQSQRLQHWGQEQEAAPMSSAMPMCTSIKLSLCRDYMSRKSTIKLYIPDVAADLI